MSGRLSASIVSNGWWQDRMNFLRGCQRPCRVRPSHGREHGVSCGQRQGHGVMRMFCGGRRAVLLLSGRRHYCPCWGRHSCPCWVASVRCQNDTDGGDCDGIKNRGTNPGRTLDRPREQHGVDAAAAVDIDREEQEEHIGVDKKKGNGEEECCREVEAVIHHEDSRLPTSCTETVETTHHVGKSIPFRALSQACVLLSSVFGHHDKVPEGVQFSKYTIRLIAALQSRAMVESSNFVLFMSHQRSTGSLVGVVTISKGLDAAGAREYQLDGLVSESKRCHVYSLCNMAVKAPFRRQGIAAHMLLCVEEYLRQLYVPGDEVTLVLSVDKYNQEAQRLYGNAGYRVDEGWIDPRWLEAVDRDRLNVPRRILMRKEVDLSPTLNVHSHE